MHGAMRYGYNEMTAGSATVVSPDARVPIGPATCASGTDPPALTARKSRARTGSNRR